MEAGDKLKELNMTVDEIDRLTNAFKDEKFREMLLDYTRELSDPENKKRYEEEIKMLEQERGNTVEFIHPEPFRALRTSVNGKQKCFINICANEKVGKPASAWGVSEEGRRGQRWSLPHSLHPGRQDIDPKGNKILIYDVIFHPDTLHIASKNTRFMDMVDSTAIQGIQDAFNVTLDKNNVREMSTKYKGTPQPCVIRRPIPGYKAKGVSEKPDPLSFPYPEDQRPASSSQTKPTESPATKNSSDAAPKIQPLETKEPTKPNYTVKYRSFIDLQDFRCSRDSAQSPRPKEIVVTIDMPLLKAVTDASLEVKERTLLLESKKPNYRLELPLAYAVDEEKGEAKFNKQRGQLTVTLPVLPSNEALDFAVSADEGQEGKSEVEEEEEEDASKEMEREYLKSEEEEERDIEEEQWTVVAKGEEEEEKGWDKGEEEVREEENSKDEEISVEEEAKWKELVGRGQESVEEEKVTGQKQENEEEAGNRNLQKRQQHEDTGRSKHNKIREDGCDGAEETRGVISWDTVERRMDVPAEEEENSCVASPETENQPVFITAERPGCITEEGDVNLNSSFESTPKMKTSDVKEETEEVKETLNESLKVETEAECLHHRSGGAASPVPADTQNQSNMTDCCISQGTEECSKMAVTHDANKSSRGGPGNGVTLSSEERATGAVKREERERIFQAPEHDDNRPPSGLLREIDKDGNEKVISDHSTSAGFIFQNSLMYELD
ncbi:protein kintoun [Dicentrarchus labrax]|uniref:protein kintoun n=1 Tax=Dicentrarchus labrax TaxID=13489 RepID=UPI0021F53A7B|nr:protein kintoun [Dicentrarchus labrax]